MSGVWGGGCVFCYGDDVNIDVFFFGKYIYNLCIDDEICLVVFEDFDLIFCEWVELGDVIVGGWNWGCGLSCE